MADIKVNVSYNDEMIAAMAAAGRDKLSEGFFPVIVVESETGVSKEKEKDDGTKTGNNHMLVPKFRVLKDADDPDSVCGPPLRRWIVLPFVNVNIPGHEPPFSAGRTMARDLNALYPDEIDPMPDVVKGKIVWKGEEISDVEKAAADKQVLKAACDKAKELLADTTAMLKIRCVAKIGYDKTNPDYPKIMGLYAELPERAEFVSPDRYFQKSAPVTSKAAGKAKGKAKRG